MKRFLKIFSSLFASLTLMFFALFNPVNASPLIQITRIPTETLQPTATFAGPTVFVADQVNIRAGPGTVYDQVGVLIAGQTAPALGRSSDSSWVLIRYVGGPNNEAWVYAPLVAMRAGKISDLKVVQLPPTPTVPPAPTGEAGGGGAPATVTPTRLPTFTPAPAVVQPTFAPAQPTGGGFTGFPPAIPILFFFVVGLGAGVVALLRQRG